MKKYSAFSLIELSIVILIIGIIIAGVTQSSRLVKQFRIRTAQTLTQSSPVNGIKDLVLWYETSMDASFVSTEAQDNTQISTWNDLNTQSISKINAVQATSTNQPKYFEDVINGLPAVRFDGVDNFLLATPVTLIGTQFSYFVVAKRVASIDQTSTFTLVGATATNDFNDSTSIVPFQEGVGAGQLVAEYQFATGSPAVHPGNGVPYIVDTVFTGSGNTTYLNGTAQTPSALVPSINVTKVYVGTRYTGGTPSTFYSGNVAELIIFNRGLKNEERKAVEAYLGKKWGIKVS